MTGTLQFPCRMTSPPHPTQNLPFSKTPENRPTSQWRRILYSPGWMVLIGFIVRVLYILLAHSYKFRTTDANFSFGWEIGRIAYSLANGHGFSAPFGGDTGPSAWTAPIYPWIVSLAFRVFGNYTHTAAFTLLTFNSLCSALTAWVIYRTARRVFNEKVAVWSGWIWALLPYVIYWSVRWIWETSLTALLFSLAFMLTVEMDGDNRLTSWVGFGVLWGVIGLTNPSTLSFLPFAGCWLAYQLIRRKKPFLLPAIVGAVLFWMTMMPWLVRNYEVFHKPVFVRDNVGVELRCGNNPLAEGIWVGMYHPSQNPILYREYQQMGEAAYSAEQSRLARQWISDNPRQFATHHLPQVRLLLERPSAPLQHRRMDEATPRPLGLKNLLAPDLRQQRGTTQHRHSGSGAGAHLALPRHFPARFRRTRIRCPQSRSRSVPLRQSPHLLPLGLLCEFPASSLSASD